MYRVKRATTFKDTKLVEYYWIGQGPIGDESPVCTGIQDEDTAKVLCNALNESMPDLRPTNWHTNNTECQTWFERDRANVSLSDLRGNKIISLWDEQVSEFIEDGFKKDRQSWHEALTEYANEHKLRAKYENT